jgi:hypothetical protein
MSDNFWARKLGLSQAPAPAPFQSTTELYPLYTSPTVEQGAVPSQQVAVPQGQAPQAQEYTPNVRLKHGDTCPGCGGDKYFRPSPSIMPTCGDCGYNPRFEQSGYGERSLPTQKGDKVAAARQVAGSQTMQASLATLNAGGGEHI